MIDNWGELQIVKVTCRVRKNFFAPSKPAGKCETVMFAFHAMLPICSDPVGIVVGLNGYVYAPNPTGWVDPLGLNKRGPANVARIDRDCNGRVRDHLGRFAADSGWPNERRFLGGKSTPITLLPETIIDRYGYPGGTFVSPVVIPFEARALPSSYKSGKPYYIYEVVYPISAQTGVAATWFKAEGMGIQHEITKTVQELLDDGSLRDLTPCS